MCCNGAGGGVLCNSRFEFVRLGVRAFWFCIFLLEVYFRPVCGSELQSFRVLGFCLSGFLGFRVVESPRVQFQGSRVSRRSLKAYSVLKVVQGRSKIKLNFRTLNS